MVDFKITKKDVDLIRQDMNNLKNIIDKDHDLIKLFDLACAKPIADVITDRTTQARKYTEIFDLTFNILPNIICNHKFGDEGYFTARLFIGGKVKIEMFEDKKAYDNYVENPKKFQPDLFFDNLYDIFLDINNVISEYLTNWSTQAFFTGIFSNLYIEKEETTMKFLMGV